MPQISRRSLIKAGVVTSATKLAGAALWADPAASNGLSSEVLPPSFISSEEVTNSPLRERLLMDFGWKFHLGDACDSTADFDFGSFGKPGTYAKSGKAGAVTTLKFDDSSWRSVDLPHDWAVELPFALDEELVAYGAKPLGRHFPATSIGWYRRTFGVAAADSGKRISVEFDGIFRNATVFFNGQRLGENFSGYVPFAYEITEFLNYGGNNALVIRVDATLHEGWFYEGAGIYRHTWLTKTADVHFVRDGVFVQTDVRSNSAQLNVQAELQNQGDGAVTIHVLGSVVDASGTRVAEIRSTDTSLAPGAISLLAMTCIVEQPKLWSLENPHLYRLMAWLEVNGQRVDQQEVSFGIRIVRFDSEKGFFLNGSPTKIKGTCNHQDHAGVGTALPDRLNVYRVELLRAMGSNACRTSHNAPTPAFLDACDRLGMLVMDETRLFSSSPEGLDELERLVRRDRNHPSVILWSIANEEPLQSTPTGMRMGAAMKRLIRGLDPSRPITAAMNQAKSWGEGISLVVDVQGFNYGPKDAIDAYHRDHPHQPLVGTETASTVSTRGIYENDPQHGYVSAYDLNFPRWAATAEDWWSVYDAREWLSGGFAWTGFDYRGEPTPYGLPCISSHFGLLDTCGFPKDNYFYYKTWWRSEPWLHLFPHWNWTGKEGQEIDVWCYSNQDAVELFLNGVSMGRQSVTRNGHLAWKVKFNSGLLEAKAYKLGQVSLTAKRQTTGAPAKLAVNPDRQILSADGEDVSMLSVSVLDTNGRIVPKANDLIAFHVEGSGRLIGVGNGDPSCHESDKGGQRSAFNGLCMGIVQSRRGDIGTVRVTVSSPGLQAAGITLQCQAIRLRKIIA